jgi:Sec-independent protein translocase protein TatA
MEPTMSQFLMVLALAVVLSLGPTFIPVVVSLVHAIIGSVRKSATTVSAARQRQPVPSPAV